MKIVTETKLIAIVLVIVSFASCAKELVPRHERNTPTVTHTTETSSPYSVLEGTAVRIKPYDATFEIPPNWIPSKFGKNLYLSRDELNEVHRKHRFDEIEAETLDAVVPFEHCAAHIGEKEWGVGVVSNQARVYVTRRSPEAIRETISNEGLSTARDLYDDVSISSGPYGDWQRVSMKTLEKGEHTLLFRNLDFFIRAYGEQTVVFVFVHQFGPKDKEIDYVLNSFKWGIKE